MSDARGGYLVCPGCGGPMLPLDLHEPDRLSLDGAPAATTQLCESCHGVWFEWFDGETSGLAQRVPILDGETPRARAGGVCPRDGAQLETQPYLDGGPAVDRCTSCLGLFAGRAQLAELAAFHERMPEGSGPIFRASLLARLWHAFGR